VKALALFSGGLDSLLAIKLIQEAGVEVEGINFLQPFLGSEEEKRVVNHLQKLISQLGVELHIVRLGDDYLRMLENPKHGYGKAANPCLDCHIFFLRKAGEMMPKLGAAFLVTGEVVGQRRKSQYRGAFPKIDTESGFAGLIVRPLSARLLPPTIPEQRGWISLDHCPSIQGRQRKIQLELAKKYGLEYETPAGGCLLTNVEYGRKVKDLIKADGQLSIDRLSLLRIGRHFRLSANYKGIVGRNHRENQALFRYFYQHRRAEGFYLFSALGAPGPLTLGLGQPGAGDLENVARLTIRYSDHPQETVVTVKILVSGRAHHLTTLSIPPAPKESPFDGNRFRIT
jgi:tRNA-specific 2-thiouridylase